MATCPKCDNTGWILFFKDAPSPPYLPDQKLEFGIRCDCNEQKTREHDKY